jgi:hypothetical protein
MSFVQKKSCFINEVFIYQVCVEILCHVCTPMFSRPAAERQLNNKVVDYALAGDMAYY